MVSQSGGMKLQIKRRKLGEFLLKMRIAPGVPGRVRSGRPHSLSIPSYLERNWVEELLSDQWPPVTGSSVDFKKPVGTQALEPNS